MIERVVILGSKGFIGSHLMKAFHGKQVIEIDLPEVDLTDTSAAGALAEAWNEKTAVIFLSCIKKDQGDTFDIFIKNVQMIANVCAAIEKKPCARLIYFSSAAVYGEEVHDTKINENTAIYPTSYYGLAKFVGERMLAQIAEKKNISLVYIRPPVIYGPGDKSSYGPSGFCAAATAGKEIIMWGDGSELREFIFIDDIVRIVHQLAMNNVQGPLNIAQGKSITFVDIIEHIKKAGKKIAVQSRERTKKKVDNAFDNARFNQVFPNFTCTSIEKGIKMLLEAK